MLNKMFCGFHQTVVINTYDKEHDCVVVDKQFFIMWGHNYIGTKTEYIYDKEDETYIRLKQEYNQDAMIKHSMAQLRIKSIEMMECRV